MKPSPSDAQLASSAHTIIVGVAREAKVTPAQVLLRWGVQHGHVILPKSVKRERIAENAALDFTLAPAQMAELDVLEQGLSTSWDPEGQA